MKIDVMISADDINREKIKNKNVVVIDMLRATSVIITAISNGCSSVIPVLTVDEAKSIVKENRAKYLLGGERNAVKIEGFDFSNSPLEYDKNIVNGKRLVMTTSNGTRAIKASTDAKNVLMGAMINAKAVAKKLVELNDDVVIVNAGTYGEFSIDDFICGGYIINCILEEVEAKLSDIATTAYYIYKSNPDVISFIKHANHYKTIQRLGLKDDLEYCCKRDIVDIVPVYEEGKIS